MAEAHQAVSYSELIKPEHTDAHHDQEVLQLVWRSGLRSWKERLDRWKRKIRNGVYPAHLESLWIVMALVMAIHFSSRKVPYDLVNIFMRFSPESTLSWQALACCLVGFVYWYTVGLMMRYTLKMLLMYKGFMFETRGKGISLQTKLWAILVKFFIKWNRPTLYSFQDSLPTLPLPSVKDTMTRYLRSVRPLLDDENYNRVESEAKEFENGIGKKLQRYLILKSWWASNYVSDWWEEYVYLRGRSPLMVNSNFYGADCTWIPSNKQLVRAASLTSFVLQFRRKIERQELKPIMAQGMVPLCSWQYERMYNTSRVPGVESDKIVHYENIKHIVVLHKGCYYKMIIHHQGRLLNSSEIHCQLEQIVRHAEKSTHAEKYLASLTAWNRTKWANAREKYFAAGVNQVSLKHIESAAFLLILHEEPYGEHTDPEYVAQCLHGRIYDRWFDKSFMIGVGTNGRYALNAEHTWADAPVLGHMIEEMHFDDLTNYDDDGNLKTKLLMKPPTPTRLQWEFSSELSKTIDEAYSDSLKVAQDVDHQIWTHDVFGKGFIKTCRLSPDAYIQMALQLAYYRDYGKFSLTYEASMTRLFKEGRTETVRSCTIESSAWVKSMEDQNSNASERMRSLNEACKRHQVGYLDAMCGRGVDRHLFCLYVVSKYLEVESPFLKEVINEPWRLSTSQTPHGQTPKINLAKFPRLRGPGGGFGPVSSDGYSVSYIISGENTIFFHLSSNRRCAKTDTTRFGERIFKAMNDIKLLFEEFNANQKKNEQNVH